MIRDFLHTGKQVLTRTSALNIEKVCTVYISAKKDSTYVWLLQNDTNQLIKYHRSHIKKIL